MTEAIDRFHRVDILFNNAGINIRKQPQELEVEEWSKVMDINLTSAFLMAKAAYPHLKRGAAARSSTLAA